jgi:membrane protein
VGDVTDDSAGTHERAPAGLSGRTAAAKQQYARLRDRVEATTPGRIRRRARELDVVNHALILASLSLTLLIPALVTLAAILPIGRDTGLAAGAMRRLGLSGQAAADLRQLFPTSRANAGSITAFSAAVTLFFAVGWPAELGRGYQSIWGLPSRGLRDLWRTVPWLVSFIAVLAVTAGSGRLVPGDGGVILTGVIAVPVIFLWAWWSQHLLLGGRIEWRALFAGAVTTSLCLLAFNLGMHVYLPRAIVENHDKYGPIGVVFALLSWIIGFSVIMLGGPLAGHTIHTARSARGQG